MMLHFETLPPSTNHLYGRGSRGVYVREDARHAKDAIGYEALQQHDGEPLEGPLKVDMVIHWPDRRKHDVDNVKAFLDALTGIVWRDDGQIVDLRIRKYLGRENPGVDLTVRRV